jgi:hypothetical protein
MKYGIDKLHYNLSNSFGGFLFTALSVAGTYGVERWDGDELERIWKEPVVAKSDCYAGIFLGGLRKLGKPQPGHPVLQLRIEPSTTCV